VKQAADLEVSGLQLESDGSAFECGSLGPVNLDLERKHYLSLKNQKCEINTHCVSSLIEAALIVMRILQTF
jgi:hypothetical protein